MPSRLSPETTNIKNSQIMAYNQRLVDQLREMLVDQPDIDEKEMMGGLAFMVDNKMCVGVIKDVLMARIDPEMYDEALGKPGCRPMDFTGKPMKGWVFIGPEGLVKIKDLEYWIGLALQFNKDAKPSKPKKQKP
jgi:TfoX/Sxy family transcriptional regulator of competence genes